jgi:hypothetical protein
MTYRLPSFSYLAIATPEKEVVVCSGGFLRISTLKAQNKAQARNIVVQTAKSRNSLDFFKEYYSLFIVLTLKL